MTPANVSAASDERVEQVRATALSLLASQVGDAFGEHAQRAARNKLELIARIDEFRAELKQAKEQHIEVATNLANQVAELTRERDEARKEAGDLVEEVIAKHNTMIGLRQQLAEAQRGVERLTHSWSEICANKESMIQTLASQAKEQQARTDDLQRQLDEARGLIRSLRTGLLCGFGDSDEEARVLDRSSALLLSAPPQAGDESGEESRAEAQGSRVGGAAETGPSGSVEAQGVPGPQSPGAGSIPAASLGNQTSAHQSQASVLDELTDEQKQGLASFIAAGAREQFGKPAPQPASVTPTRARSWPVRLVFGGAEHFISVSIAERVISELSAELARLENGGGEEE